jgi:predicted signal transduction protein with EAL and GGDEF domain
MRPLSPTKGYCVLYINTLADKSAYSDFKKILEFLPLEYFIHLNSIYVLQASFLAKASNWLSFNMLTSYVKDKTIHVSTFMEITNRVFLQPEYLFELMPKDIAADLCKN